MNQSYQTRLKALLDNTHCYACDGHGCGGFSDPDRINMKEAQQQITELFLEIIGEDENHVVPEPIQGIDQLWLEGRGVGETTGRNNLKAELRKAIKLGEDTDE